MGVRRRRCWIAWGAGLLLALPDCGVSIDLERARRLLRGPEKPDLPTLRESPAAQLPAPEGLRTTSGELRKVPLQWDPLLRGDVGGYVIERSDARDGPFERIAALAGRATTAYVDEGASAPGRPEGEEPEASLGDESTRFYRVRAFSADGRVASAASQVVAATTSPLPAPPEGLRAYSRQPRQVPLSWRAAPDPNTALYVVERSPTSGGPFEPVAEIRGRYNTVHVDRRLGDLRVFYYRVSAVNSAGGRGEPTQPVRAVTKPEPLPPLGLHVAERRLGANQLSWDTNVEKDLVEYQLLRIREGADAPELVASVPVDTTSAEDSGVAAGESVAYTVIARDRDGLESDPAQPISVESEGYGLSARVTPEGVELDWNSRKAEGFRNTRVHSRRGWRRSEIAFVDGSRYLDRDVEPGHRYRYTVTLERADSTQAPTSEPIEVVVPPR